MRTAIFAVLSLLRLRHVTLRHGTKKSVDRGKTDAYCRGNGNGIGNKKMTLTPDHTGR
jgi:hypothetical protein